jgi:hypothetical protein
VRRAAILSSRRVALPAPISDLSRAGRGRKTASVGLAIGQNSTLSEPRKVRGAPGMMKLPLFEPAK